MIGTPAALIVWRAATFDPISSIASGGGPIQTSPAASTARAKSAFSARNPYPGMERLGAGALGGIQDPLLVEIAIRRSARADEIRLVGEAGVQRSAVGLGVHGDRRDPELAKRSEDADCDLAAICNEDFREVAPSRAYSLRPWVLPIS